MGFSEEQIMEDEEYHEGFAEGQRQTLVQLEGKVAVDRKDLEKLLGFWQRRGGSGFPDEREAAYQIEIALAVKPKGAVELSPGEQLQQAADQEVFRAFQVPKGEADHG